MLPERGPGGKAFDYAVPESFGLPEPGRRVRVPLGRRSVGGWVLGPGGDGGGHRLRPLAGDRGLGPAPEVVALTAWAAWRWAGRREAFLVAASPPRLVRSLPEPARAGDIPRAAARAAGPIVAGRPELGPRLAEALRSRAAVARVGPASPAWPWLLGALASLAPGCSALVLVPSLAGAARVHRTLVAAGIPAAHLPDGWAAAAAGGRVVVGSRAGALGPCPDLGLVVVLDAHDEGFVETRAPTWDAVALSRARAARAGAAWLAVSACPTVELLAGATLVAEERARERGGWAPLEVVDLREVDPRQGLLTRRVVELARQATSDRPLRCVLNRTGRARVLCCAACREPVRCEACGTPLEEDTCAGLRCPGCGARRPGVCAACGATKLSRRRPGVARLAEELATLAGRPVVEVTASTPPGAERNAAVVVGTEAVLHRAEAADAEEGRRTPGDVALLDLDTELLGARLRAAEEALALVARAARVAGGRERGCRVLVQTSLPGHEVVRAAQRGEPGLVTASEEPRRSLLRLPPHSALASVTGPLAAAWTVPLQPPIEVVPAAGGRMLVRAPDVETLCNALEGLGQLPVGVRVEVDPRRI